MLFLTLYQKQTDADYRYDKIYERREWNLTVNGQHEEVSQFQCAPGREHSPPAIGRAKSIVG